jgi:hypothetical protein
MAEQYYNDRELVVCKASTWRRSQAAPTIDLEYTQSCHGGCLALGFHCYLRVFYPSVVACLLDDLEACLVFLRCLESVMHYMALIRNPSQSEGLSLLLHKGERAGG